MTVKSEVLNIVRANPEGVTNSDIASLTGGSVESIAFHTNNLYRDGKIDKHTGHIYRISKWSQQPRPPTRMISKKEIIEILKAHPSGLTAGEIMKVLKIENTRAWLCKVHANLARIDPNILNKEEIINPERAPRGGKHSIIVYSIKEWRD